MFLKSTRRRGYSSAERWKECYKTLAFLNIGSLLESFHSRMRPNRWAWLRVGLSRPTCSCDVFLQMILSVSLYKMAKHTWSVRKVSDLWPGKRNWLTWSAGHLITLKVVPLGLHTLLPAVPPLLEACRKSLFRNGV